MPDDSAFKLGCLPMYRPKAAMLLQATDYMSLSTLPAPAPSTHWSGHARLGRMFLNDRYGCCVVAAGAHHDQVMSRVAGHEYDPADSTISKTYFGLTGGPDVGLDPLVFMSWWQKTGFTRNHQLLGYIELPLDDPEMIAVAGDLFAGVQFALNLPLTAQTQGVWDSTGSLSGNAAPGSWGGHMVYGPDRAINYTVATWGMLKAMTPAFLRDYGYVALAAIGSEWKGKTIRGFDSDHLLADIAAIRGRRP